MIVLHAVTPPLTEEADTEGLSRHVEESLTVLYDEADEPPGFDRRTIAEHGARLVRLAETNTVLPMRFGTWTESVAELEAMVHEYAPSWRHVLSRVEGHHELIVHLDTTAEPEPEPRSPTGAEYLRRRAETLRRQDEQWAALESLVGQFSREMRLLPDRHRMAVLVRRELTGMLRDALAAWSETRPGPAVELTGPWPPFSFCDEREQP
jgi:hypothetical protein